MSLWAELKRRSVFRVAAAYLVAAWLIVQVIGELIDPLGLPDSLDTIVVVLLGIGFPIALVIAWIYEVTPDGIRVTADAATSPPAGQSTHRLNYVIVVLLVLAVGLLAFDMLALNGRDGRPEALAGVSEAANAEEESANASEADAEAAVALTLAVLPFDDSSQADEAMARARELTPDLPELILTDLDRRLAGGQPDFFVVEQGIEAYVSGAAANDYPAHDIASIQALLQYQTGRIREATSMFERVRAVDPMDASKNMMLAEAYGAQGRFDDGLRVLDEIEGDSAYKRALCHRRIQANPSSQADTPRMTDNRAHPAGEAGPPPPLSRI